MKLLDRVQLIPRNNWDYGITALLVALAGLRTNGAQSPNCERVFGQNPIWTTSGRASLYAILKSLELLPGARVGVPLFCCSVVFDAIRKAGLSPCFLDVNLDDFNLSVDDLRKKCADLAAIVVVHMFGKPCDMDAILAVADGRPVIEDCAQSILSTYKGIPTGSLATASFFSFRCGKYISAGEGSAILCREQQLHEKIEQVVDSFARWSVLEMLIHAFTTFGKAALYNRPWYGLLGYPIGTRLDKKLNLTAKAGFDAGQIAPSHLALIDTRIAGFHGKVDIQREHAYGLLRALEPGDFLLPSESDGFTSNWFQFALRFQTTGQRDAMADYLFDQGIDTAKYLDDIVDETRSNYGYVGDCPNVEQLSKTVLLVPIHYTLSTADIARIIRAVNQGSRKIREADGR